MYSYRESYQSFLPRHLVRSVCAGGISKTQPTRLSTRAAALLFDVSGFTSLCERYTRLGPEGIEHLTNLLGVYFGTLVEAILAHGGDIVSFGGDAMIAVWEGEDAQESVARAVACGLALQRRMVEVAEQASERLELKVAVDEGDLHFIYGGGVLSRWEAVVAGPALDRICSPELLLVPQSVTLAPGLMERAGLRATVQLRPDGWVELSALEGAPRVEGSAPIDVPWALRETMETYIQRSIRVRLDSGQRDWLAELREISAVFISLADVDVADDLDETHHLLVAIQHALYRYEGSLYQFFADGKGATIIAAFGLPLLSHEDDAARSVLAALAVKKAIEAAGATCQIGVASGVVFSGIIGTPQRRLYALIGDAMNLSARLMQAAEGGILCDEVTMAAARDRVEFEALPAIAVRGRQGTVSPYRPLFRRRLGQATADAVVIGRQAERQALLEQLELLEEEGGTRAVVLEGEAGIGKSAVVALLVQSARTRGLEVRTGGGDAIEKYTPWFAWRGPLRDLAGQLVGKEPPAVVAALVALGVAEQDAGFAPLLNPLLGLELPESEVTGQMSGDARGETTHRLVVQLLAARSKQGPQVIVLEDAQWFDSASWQLTLAVARSVENLLLLVSSRPRSKAGEEAMRELLALPGAPGRIVLEGLAPEEIELLAARRLGVNRLPTLVSELIVERCSGNPFYAEQLLAEVVDSGAVAVENGSCRVVDGELMLESLPRNLQGILRARIDRVEPGLQLTLKVASVIGREFDTATLEGIYPVEELQAQLPEHMERLSRLDLTPQLREQPVARYWFRQAMTRDVAYNLMLFSQRRALHRSLAAWLERRHGDDARWLPQLTHHWTMADEAPQAVAYGVRSARQALDAYANREALAFIEEAERLEADAGLEPSTEERAHREEICAEALMRLGRYTEAIEHYESVLTLLGAPIPRKGAGVATQLISELVVHLWGRLRGKGSEPGPGAALARRSAGIRNELMKLYFFGQRIGEGLYTMIRQLNEASVAGPSPELASSLASAGAFFSVLGMPGKARHYNETAEALLDDIEHIATKGYVNHVLCFQFMFAARWDEAAASLEASNGHYQRLGASHTEPALHPQVNLAVVDCLRGRLSSAVGLLEQVLVLAQGSANQVSQLQAHAFLAELWLRQEVHASALEHAVKALEIIGDQEFPAERLVALSVLARAHQLRGEAEDAGRCAEALLPLLKFSPGTPYTLGWGLCNAADYLAQELEAGRGDRASQLSSLGRAHKALAGFAKVFRFGGPMKLRVGSRRAGLLGKGPEARRLAQECVELSRAIEMPYEEALGLRELARNEESEQQRSTLEGEAAAVLAAIGAEHQAPAA